MDNHLKHTVGGKKIVTWSQLKRTCFTVSEDKPDDKNTHEQAAPEGNCNCAGLAEVRHLEMPMCSRLQAVIHCKGFSSKYWYKSLYLRIIVFCSVAFEPLKMKAMYKNVIKVDSKLKGCTLPRFFDWKIYCGGVPNSYRPNCIQGRSCLIDQDDTDLSLNKTHYMKEGQKMLGS